MVTRNQCALRLVEMQIQLIRACLHGGGGPQVGEETCLAVVEKWPVFTRKLTTPGSLVTLLDIVAWSLGM